MLASHLRSLTAGLLVASLIHGAPQRCRNALEYGINPSFQNFSSRAIVFADAFQRAREISLWNGAAQGPAPLIPLGSGLLGEGWPDVARLAAGQRCGANLFVAMEGTIPDGRSRPFVVTWSGAGSASIEGVFVAGERNRSANRVEVLIDPTRGGGNGALAVSWLATDATDPVRDVHVWLPGMENAGAIFWPPFVERVRATNAGRGPHTWRTLDWTRVNDYGRPAVPRGFTFDLAGVIRPNSPSQGTARGVATEYQVAFCNLLGTNLHYQLPHRTNDLSEADYRAFLERELTVIRDGAGGFAGLDPSLTVTVELSNEIWNSIFPVNAWMGSEANRKGITFAEQIAGEIQRMFDVARAVFAGPHAARLRTFVGGFVVDPGYLRRVLAKLRPGTQLDAIGPATYLGPRRTDIDAWLVGSTTTSCPNCPGVDGLITNAQSTVDFLRPLVAEHARIADGWTNPDGSHSALELYEAGLNLKSIGQPWAAAARAAQTDARLFALFADRLVPMLVQEGVSLVNWYSFMTDQDSGTVDAFGMWNDMGQALTLPMIRPYAHEGAPKAAVICLGPPLVATCPLASAVARTAPLNPNTFTSSAPVLGGPLRLSVDLSSTTNTAAFVVVSFDAVQVPLTNGQTLLAAIDRAEILSTRRGPLATWTERVPNDARLAGITLSAQAVQFGGPDVNFTNAMDWVLGR